MTRKIHPRVMREIFYGYFRGVDLTLIFLSPFYKAKNRFLANLLASFWNPLKVAGLKTSVLPCSWARFLPD